ncbi:EthD domain-containing protein [Pseudomonas sp. OTU5201]|uniref:EthD domain-containing protein n=1 Tax=Pseudomonas sp. OTU5201 TaxID=3043850 RepID=UPI00313BF55F
MIKLILLVRRKESLSFDEFRSYYESTHAPLAAASLPRLRKYCRNYLKAFPGQDAPLFDCVTEFWFDDEQGLSETLKFAHSPEGQVLAEDEERFMDRKSMRTYIADETPTQIQGEQ